MSHYIFPLGHKEVTLSNGAKVHLRELTAQEKSDAEGILFTVNEKGAVVVNYAAQTEAYCQLMQHAVERVEFNGSVVDDFTIDHARNLPKRLWDELRAEIDDLTKEGKLGN